MTSAVSVTPAKATRKPAARSGKKRRPVGQVNASAIQPRRMDFHFDPDIPRYWFAGDQFKTTLLTALSCTFPEGERFFVRSVRYYQPNIKEPKLKEEVKGFIGQEAHHGNEHETFNAFMRERGMPTDEVEKFTLEGLKWLAKRYSRERQLAKTCALEHFTAMLAETILENPEFLEGMDERMVPLWLWHAVEESEHKAVAYDVYQNQVANYWIRTSEMAVTTVEFLGFTAFHYYQLRRGTDDATDFRSILNGLNWLLGKPGLLRKLAPRWRAYFKPGFHPNKRDGSVSRKRGLERLAKMLNRPELVEGNV